MLTYARQAVPSKEPVMLVHALYFKNIAQSLKAEKHIRKILDKGASVQDEGDGNYSVMFWTSVKLSACRRASLMAECQGDSADFNVPDVL